MGVNSKYKDSLFSWLFSDTDALRELYGAIEGVTLDPATPITINTLEGVLFMDRMNDISFEIAGKLVVLIEHQSTINPNMALRMLMYIGRIYERITGSENIYSEKKLTIPQPEFIVLYNGKDPYPDETTLKLSDSFKDAPSLGLAKQSAMLELTAKVYNINEGKNEAISRNCRRLYGYSVFVAKAREFENTAPDKRIAMKMAAEFCIKHNILKEIFEAHASEVINMLLTEWNWDDAKVVWQREAREEGEKKGEKKKALETAKNFLGMGLSQEQVARGTGLDMETIKELIVQ
ncbi:hypothetical protein FACS1894110_04050 [Spirochaetia bacterium]|nr:hypothetical protein FACS1894110_04050 [Spirochaetia bacterium]